MTSAPAHIPVLARPIVDCLKAQIDGGHPASVIVDCTFGRGGHTRLMQEAAPGARVIALDRDPDAIAHARGRSDLEGVELVHGVFSELPGVLAERGIDAVDFLLADFGVSSPQLDVATRGFSFMRDGPLDMRMDPSAGVPVSELIAQADEEELARILRDYGEVAQSRRAARRIKELAPTRTLALAEAFPRRPGSKGIHPATTIFQALRIWVNDELGEIETLLAALPAILRRPGGRAALISFHSLEDRAVKRFVRGAENPCVCPKGLPTCLCGREPTLRSLHGKAIKADGVEAEQNPRARSARLRLIERLS